VKSQSVAVHFAPGLHGERSEPRRLHLIVADRGGAARGIETLKDIRA
jgi:hypothetical protein